MKNEDWSRLNHFSIDEKTPWYTPAWGDPSKMNLYLLLQLDAMREYVGSPFRIHCGYEITGHAPNSYHNRDGLGRAVDFSCEGVDVDELFITALRFDFTSIGKYRYWSRPGLHVDVRPLSHFQPKVCWEKDKHGVYVYYSRRRNL